MTEREYIRNFMTADYMKEHDTDLLKEKIVTQTIDHSEHIDNHKGLKESHPAMRIMDISEGALKMQGIKGLEDYQVRIDEGTLEGKNRSESQGERDCDNK